MSMPYVPDAYGGSNGGSPNGKPQAVPNQYPPMVQIPDTKPLLDALGATGVAIMSGIITSEEYNPDWFWRDGVHIVEQMLRNDGQIAAVREMVELPLRSATWSIKPGSDEPRDQEIAAMVQSALFDEMCYTTASGRKLTQKWDDTLRQILLHIFYGFMVFELNYRVEDGWIKWSRWTPLLPRTIYRWWVGPDTELAGIQQWTWKDYGYHFVDIPADKLLHFANRMEGNNYEGVSALRAPYKHWFYKDQFYKIDAIGIERNAVVPPVIKLLPGFSDSDAAIAKQIVENVRVNENMGVVITPQMDFEYPKNQQRYAANTLTSIQHHDVMIARAFLAQFINLGSTETGAYALNQSQMEQFLASLQARAKYISDVINPEIKRLVDYNYNDVSVYPTLECSKIVAQNISDLAEIFSKLMTGQAPLITPTPDLADWLLDQVGAPLAPRNEVETSNPGSDATPERPQNERRGEHSDEETQNVSPQSSAGRGRRANNRGSAASSAGDAGADGGDASGGMAAETDAMRQEARLLREALDAAYGVDAVERGMVFSNPYPRQKGGLFGFGGNHGQHASSGHGGQSRGHHEEGGHEHPGQSRSGSHGGGGGGGRGKSASKEETAKPVAKATRTRAPKAEKPASEKVAGKTGGTRGSGKTKAEQPTGKHNAELEHTLRHAPHNPYQPYNPYAIHEEFGAAKMRSMLTAHGGSQSVLRQMTAHVEKVTGTRAPSHTSKEQMVAMLADDAPQPDTRRITEHDPALLALKNRTIRQLTSSVRQLVRDLRPGNGVQQGEAQSQFIHRHVDILRAAYRVAHQEGQRDYYGAVSRAPRKWATLEPDEATISRRLAFYAPSVAKMAHEATIAANSTPALSDLSLPHTERHSEQGAMVTLADGGSGDALTQWQQGTGARITLQADLTWSGAQDGYVAAGFGDSANPYSSLWWDLEPVASHCQDCPVFAAMSPYDPPWTNGGNILNATPGDGNTECGAACKCSLRYGGAVDGSARAQDWKAWLPQGTPDTPEGPMVPVQPPAGKKPQKPARKPPPGRMPPSPFEPPVRQSPYGPIIPGGEFNAGQKAALDLYRLAELNWNKVRGALPELPNFFTLANPNFSWTPLKWEELTKAQQHALSMALEAFFRWGANTPPEWLDYYDDYDLREPADGEDVILSNPYPRQSHGRFGFGPGIAHGGGSHGESQHAGAGHAGAGHVSEHVGAAHGGGGGGGGGAGGGGSGASSKGAKKLETAQNERAAARRAYLERTQEYGTIRDVTNRRTGDPALSRSDPHVQAARARQQEALERQVATRRRLEKLEAHAPKKLPRYEERFDMEGNLRSAIIHESGRVAKPDLTAHDIEVNGRTTVSSQAHENLERAFGRHLSDEEVRSLVGSHALDGVHVETTSRGDIYFYLHGWGYTAERTLQITPGGLVMHNDIFEVEPGAQGHGIGTAVLARQVRGLNRLGVIRIDTLAARSSYYNGYYTWPRLGYNAHIDMESLGETPESLRGITDLHTLMRTSEGRNWWREYGVQMNMSFDTTTGSRSMQVLDAYLAAKGMANG